MTTQPNETSPSAEERETPKPNGSPPPTAKAKKATKAKRTEKAQDAAQVGSATAETLLALAQKAGKAEGVGPVKTLANKLAKGAQTRRDLVALRDAVNALSATLREANQKALAKQLAVANRAVRRLERAAR